MAGGCGAARSAATGSRTASSQTDSALLLGLDDEARLYLDRLQAAYPEAHAAWLRARARP